MNRLAVLTMAVLLAGVLTVGASAQMGGPAKGGGVTGPKAMGQGGPGGQDRAAAFKKRQQEMYAKLKLTAGQKKKVDALVAQQMKDMKALMDAPGDRESKRAKFQAMRKKNDESLKKILTVAQYKQLDTMRQQMRSRTGGGPGMLVKPGGKGGPPPPRPKGGKTGGKGG